MDAVLILQIITIVISASSVFFNIFITKTENAKRNRLDIITKQRIANMQSLREKCCVFLALIKPMILQDAALTGTDKFKSDFAKAAADIQNSLKLSYDNEKIILDIVSQIEEKVSSYLNTKDTQIAGEIKELSNDFYLRTSAYDLADWKFIKNQALGTSMGSEEFDEIYNDILTKFKK